MKIYLLIISLLFILSCNNNSSIDNSISHDALDSDRFYESIRNREVEYQKLKVKYIGNSVQLDSLEIAEFDLPKSLSFIDAMLICQDLGDGWRLPNKSEMIKIFYDKSIKNLEKPSPSSGTYWISEFKDINEIPKGQLQTASYLIFYYDPPKLNSGYVGATYNSRIVRTLPRFMTKADSLKNKIKFEKRIGGGINDGGEYLSK